MKKFFSKIRINAPVILSFAGICLVVYVLDILTAGVSTSQFFCVYRSSFANPMTYIRCITHVFGHANLEHLMSNMLLFLVLGAGLEEKYGGKNIALMMLLTAFFSGLANILFFPDVATLGASGIVFAMILLSSITETEEGKIPLTFLLVAALYIGREIYDGIFAADNVSQFSHIIGGIMGSLFGFAVRRKRV